MGRKVNLLVITHNNRYGFWLDGYQGSAAFYCETRAERKNWIHYLRKVCTLKAIMSKYDLNPHSKLLGKGSFAQVHQTARKKDGKQFAVKTVKKERLLENDRNMRCFFKEIDILRRLNHPNIIKFYELYESELYIHVVLEYLPGGDVLLHLQNKGVYSEKDASLVTRRILEALDYCHSRGIIHRDLKPENLIIVYSLFASYNSFF